MEAPDKIYRTTTYLDNDKGKTLWKEAPVKGAENVEYTNTDAFINKAWDWIEDNIMSTNQRDESLLYFEQFKNYMEGE